MYQLYILDNWESVAQFCAVMAEQKTICAPISASGNTQNLQCDPLSPLQPAQVLGVEFMKLFTWWFFSVPVSGCKKFSQVSDGLNASTF